MTNLKAKIKEFFSKLGFEGDLEIEKTEEGQRINFKSEESAFLIGYRGKTMRALARLLRLVLGEEGKDVILDINNYQKEKIDHLQSLAFEFADKAKRLRKPQVLPFMSAYERRIVHMALKEREDVISESEGEEPRRRVVIRPKK